MRITSPETDHSTAVGYTQSGYPVDDRVTARRYYLTLTLYLASLIVSLPVQQEFTALHPAQVGNAFDPS